MATHWRCLWAVSVLLTGACTKGEAASPATHVTVYERGAALISETREVSLQAGGQTLRLSGLPERIRPETLWLSGEGVRLRALGYRSADSRRALLESYVGETVTLLRTDGAGGDIEARATLLSARPVPVVRIEDRIETLDGDSPWRIVLQSLPEGAMLVPGLELTVDAASAGERPLRLTYQTDGLTWQPGYVARFDESASRLTLNARATLDNGTGTDLKSAELALIAGEVARDDSGGPRPMAMRMESAAAADAVVAEQAFEYYRYEIPHAVTLRDGERRSIALFDTVDVDVAREYRIEGGWRSVGDAQRSHAAIRLSFENDLGKPLPGGAVRVYDAAEPPMLLGEARIPDTPKAQPAVLTLGRSFDITAERKTLESERDGKAREIERRIVVANAKDREVEVKLVESLPGDWRILSQTADHDRLDANRVAWSLTIPAGGETGLRYRIRYR